MKEPTLKEMRELVKFRRRVKELLGETPSYDAETVLSARQVGQQLDELRRGLQAALDASAPVKGGAQ